MSVDALNMTVRRKRTLDPPQGYSVRRVEMKESSSVYMTLAFAGIALVAAMVVGVVVIRRRNGRHPHHQVNVRRLCSNHVCSKTPHRRPIFVRKHATRWSYTIVV
jgi:hypothetical protein